MAEIATLDDAEQAHVLAYVEQLKAARAGMKSPELASAQARARAVLAVDLSPFRVSLAGHRGPKAG
ncbi:MAG TPA: hypothetical protein VGM74_09005 [Burkholderiaceae bacterium]